MIAKISESSKRKIADLNSTIDDLISLLKEDRLSRVDTIKFLVESVGLSMASSKDLVHKSNAWSELRASSEQMHEQILRGISDPSQPI